MKREIDLNRFIEAQEGSYTIALAEIKSGKKQSHWMWYIFPQLAGLGFSETSKFYAIKNLNEAQAFLQHPVLGNRLKEISTELLNLEQSDPQRIFGSPDYLKLKSSMTLFATACDEENNIFLAVIKKYFIGKFDQKTIISSKNKYLIRLRLYL